MSCRSVYMRLLLLMLSSRQEVPTSIQHGTTLCPMPNVPAATGDVPAAKHAIVIPDSLSSEMQMQNGLNFYVSSIYSPPHPDLSPPAYFPTCAISNHVHSSDLGSQVKVPFPITLANSACQCQLNRSSSRMSHYPPHRPARQGAGQHQLRPSCLMQQTRQGH